MAKYLRIGHLVVGGVEYPAAITVSTLMELEDKGISIEGVLTTEGRRWTNLLTLITLAINTGIRLTGSEMMPVDADALADCIDISDLGDLSEQIAGLLGRKNRTVEADPPKN